MKRLLVTGAAGFIGSNFVRYMLDKYPDYRILAFDALTYAGNLDNFHDLWDNPNFQFFQGRIEDPVIVDNLARNCDAMVNFAAESHNDRAILDPYTAATSNFNGVHVLLEAARKFGHERFVQISTDEVYGSTSDVFREGDALEPNQPYSAAKAGGELMVRAYHVTFGVPTIVTRGSNTFGPYHYPEKLIPLMVTNAIDDQPLPVYGDGKQVREWLHAEDHSAAIELVLREGASGEIYNVGGEDHENLEVTHRILELTGANPALVRHVEDRAGHDRRYAVDDGKLRALGWRPQHSFGEAGLATTVAWYRDNRAWWEPIKSGDYRRYYDEQYAARLAG